MSSNEFGACLCLSYNIGLGAFAKSTVLREINAGNKGKAAEAFKMWNKAGGKVVKGLVNRRSAEANLFITKDTPEPDMHMSETEEPTAKNVLVDIFHAISALLMGMKK